jgi:glycosyltransferase involved in cell wall biosynthesis
MAAQFDFATCTTRAELGSLRQLGVRTPSDWFPNGVDATFFSPMAPDYDPDLIMFVGRMDYYPNQQAVTYVCQDVLPALRAKRPGARFAIVGADPPPQIRNLARLANVSVTGSVADGRPSQDCPRHAEQDTGVYGQGRSRRLQPPGKRRGRRGRRRALAGGTRYRGVCDGNRRSSRLTCAAAAARRRRTPAGAVASRLGKLDAPDGPAPRAGLGRLPRTQATSPCGSRLNHRG